MLATQFFKYLPDYLSPQDKELVKRAYLFAYNKHKGQYRQNEEPYIVHPMAVAKILIDIHADAASICAGLLHDVVEDTSASEEEVKEGFGDDITELVMAVTKLEKLNYSSKEEHQAENFRKMFFAMAKDMRVVFIKLADRLHNMRTLGYMKPEKQKDIAKETLDIFAPLANRLGIWNIKAELEDLSFRYIYPDDYFELVAKLNIDQQETDGLIVDFINKINTELQKAHIKAEVKGRAKHLYSIYNKMKKHGKDIADIYDKLAIRVVVDDKKDCYAVLGLAHSVFKPIPDRFKDYIAMPKNNLYQSLHTGVIFNGYPFEIQIRTKEMHNIAEYGIAAHWQYKEHGASAKKADHKINWLRQMVENQKDISDAKEFLSSIKLDLFADEVFVFTPRGDLISLPIHSTPLDFAYRIHSDIGNHCSGAKINNRIVPINSKLHTGDIVEIITNKNSHPTRDWLNYDVASSTKNKIRQWLKKTYRTEYIVDGQKLYSQILTRLHLEDNSELEAQVLHIFHIPNMEALYEALGYGDITSDNMETKLRHWDKKQHEHIIEEGPKHPHKPAAPANVVSQVSNMLMHFPKCCSAIPGDPIKGVVTKGRGISVHHIDCQYIHKADPNRLIDISWGQEGRGQIYPVTLLVEMLDRVGILKDVVTIISDTKTNIRDAKMKSKQNSAVAFINITIEVSGMEHLNSIINKIQKLPDVINIRRQRAVLKI